MFAVTSERKGIGQSEGGEEKNKEKYGICKIMIAYKDSVCMNATEREKEECKKFVESDH